MNIGNYNSNCLEPVALRVLRALVVSPIRLSAVKGWVEDKWETSYRTPEAGSEWEALIRMHAFHWIEFYNGYALLTKTGIDALVLFGLMG